MQQTANLNDLTNQDLHDTACLELRDLTFAQDIGRDWGSGVWTLDQDAPNDFVSQLRPIHGACSGGVYPAFRVAEKHHLFAGRGVELLNVLLDHLCIFLHS